MTSYWFVSLMSSGFVAALTITLVAKCALAPAAASTFHAFRGSGQSPCTAGRLSFGPIETNVMFSVTSACAGRTGAAARVERRRRER